MKRLAIGAFAIALIATPAFAADMVVKAPPPATAPAYSWMGLYLGGQVGYDDQRTPTTYAADPSSLLFVGFAAALANGTLASATNQNGSGIVGGVTAGYNVQTGIAVWGIEADFDDVSNKHTSSISPPPAVAFPTLTTTATTRTEWLATVRGRLGTTVLPDTLLFGTAGLAAGRIYNAVSIIPSGAGGATCANNGFCSMGSTTNVRFGWTAGGGVERVLTAHLTAKIEYLYYNLGSVNYAATEQSAAFLPGPVAGPTVDVHTSLTGQLVRAGLNYRF